MQNNLKITYDRAGTPAFWASSVPHAYTSLGWLHGHHRPLQSLLLHWAGLGQLGGILLPRRDLIELDALIWRLNLPSIAARAAEQLTSETATLADAYLQGLRQGLASVKNGAELRVLLARGPEPSRASMLGGLMVSAYLGLAQSQDRMERALIESVAQGALPETLQFMFAPHLSQFAPHLWSALPRNSQLGFAARNFLASGGSNAWAIGGARSQSGTPLLAGDPHLQINQLPAVLFEMRGRINDNYWLGATIPGLPSVAVGRNRTLAWSGTFSCADNNDFFIYDLEKNGNTRQAGPIIKREVLLKRRGRKALQLVYFDTSQGATLDCSPQHEGPVLGVQWAGSAGVARALGAYMTLPLCQSAAEADKVLEEAHTLSLHFVLADRSGDVRHVQAGTIPRRNSEWHGLDPRDAQYYGWQELLQGRYLPRQSAHDAMIVSANEGRLSPEGITLATMAQPHYRLSRIEACLKMKNDHQLKDMQALQLDLFSLQGQRFRAGLTKLLPPGAMHNALAQWDGCYSVDSVGAHAFELCYRAARASLAQELGGQWFLSMLKNSELPVWWCAALDRMIEDALKPDSHRHPRLRVAMHQIGTTVPVAWGSVQKWHLKHMIFGDLPDVAGFNRGPFALPGSVATVCQGNNVAFDGNTVSVAPAYRFTTDLGEEVAYSALPGGCDGSRWDKSYSQWLDEYRRGEYHQLNVPRQDESEL